jgi:uncharacterized membrane protein (TIGR02234 family)
VRRSPRREYVAALALGAVGAGLVLLCARQDWARVVTTPPEPLPATSVRVSGQSLVPLAGALAVAGLAGLAAVIATRRLARRLTGLLLAVFGVVLAVVVSIRLRAADVAAAAHGGTGSVTGSATAGGAGGSPALPAPGSAAPGLGIAGHVTMTGFPWRPLSVVGALMIVVAGLAVAWRGGRWPAMSARYEPPTTRKPAFAARGDEPTGEAGSGLSVGAEPGGREARRGGRESPGREKPGARDPSRGREEPDSAALWEALSAGIDPTDPG